MIREIISMIVHMLLNKKKYPKCEWAEYDSLTAQMLGVSAGRLTELDTREIIDRYATDPEKIAKIELAAVTLLKIADDTEEDILQKSRLRQNGIALLDYVEKAGDSFSLQRTQLLAFLRMNE